MAHDDLSIAQLQDLFLLHCNEGRDDVVALALTDTMYRRRPQTGGAPTQLSRRGFRALAERAGLTGAGVDAAFLKNLGFTDPRHPRFELKFEHFLDALQDLAEAVYSDAGGAEDSLRALLTRNIRPLYVQLFGAGGDDDGGGDDGDGRSVTTTRTARLRRSQVVLTVTGSAPSSADVLGPRVPLCVVGAGDAASVASPTPAAGTLRRALASPAVGLAVRVGEPAAASPRAGAGGARSVVGASGGRRASVQAPAVGGASAYGGGEATPSRSDVWGGWPKPSGGRHGSGSRGDAAAASPVGAVVAAAVDGGQGRDTTVPPAPPQSPPADLARAHDLLRALADAAAGLQAQVAALQAEVAGLRAENARLRAGAGAGGRAGGAE